MDWKISISRGNSREIWKRIYAFKRDSLCPYNRKHDWNEGEEFPGLSDIVELLQPENILKASDKELCEKVIPKTANHIKPSQVKTLRRGAKRVLLRQDKKKQVNSLK